MNITVYHTIGTCTLCKAVIVEKGSRLVCPQWRWFRSGHYRGDANNTSGYGVGATVGFGCREIAVPDADSTWTPMTSPPAVAGTYDTLNSLTGQVAVLFKSIDSGGWWVDRTQWPELVTHWREHGRINQGA